MINAKTKSPKKGSNLLCRVANPTPEKVCEYVKRLPKQIIPENEFREIMGPKWFSNEHQAPEQWGLYYIDGTYFYPRFNRNISTVEAQNYLNGWLKRLIVINPYTRFKTVNDNGLVLSIVEQLEKRPAVTDLKEILTAIIGSDEPFIINDILANTLNAYSEVLDIEIIDKENEMFEVKLKPDYQRIIKNKYTMEKKEYFELFNGILTDFDPKYPLQQIFYGAPGTGKSYELNRLTKRKSVIRTTFHPDSDYSTFVGSYKPTMTETEAKVIPVVLNKGISLEPDNGLYKEKRITYTFVKQAFLKAYLAAWKKYAEAGESASPQFLIIEEINRGNCAQIFGDIFQLLDRADNKFSSYPIEADSDLQAAIQQAFAEEEHFKLTTNLSIDGCVDDYCSNYESTLSDDVQQGRVLLLPPNLYIWATMNTSDQSLFPIDSAFKRRWDWNYMPISDAQLGWIIEVGSQSYDWWSFLEKINEKIGSTTNSEDKKLGYFFCKTSDGKISAEKFVGKVVFYLWNDVFKDYEFNDSIFDDNDGSKLTFDKFYTVEGMDTKIATEKVAMFLENLGLAPLSAEESETTGSEHTRYVIQVNGKEVKYNNEIPYKTIQEYINLHPKLSAQDILKVWKPFKKCSMRKWIVCDKKEHESMDTRYANYSYQIDFPNGESIWVNKDGWMHHPQDTQLRDTIQEFIDAVNQADLGVHITEEALS